MAVVIAEGHGDGTVYRSTRAHRSWNMAHRRKHWAELRTHDQLALLQEGVLCLAKVVVETIPIAGHRYRSSSSRRIAILSQCPSSSTCRHRIGSPRTNTHLPFVTAIRYRPDTPSWPRGAWFGPGSMRAARSIRRS